MTQRDRDIHTVVGVFAPLYPPAFLGGGPIRSVAAMVQSAPTGYELFVLTSDRDLGASQPLPIDANTWQRRGRASVYYATASNVARLLRAMRALRSQRPRLLHFNGFFNPRFTILPLLLARFGYWGRPIVLISPRGEFGSGALGRRTAKKKLYLAIFRVLRLHHYVVWHSTAVHETSSIRSMWGPTAKVILRENDTMLPLVADPPIKRGEGPPSMVFLGRIVEHKGLLIALHALRECAVPLTLAVYGAKEDKDYLARCKLAAQHLPSHVVVNFYDAVMPDEVRAVLAEHDVLLMPTAGENFGHVIAEALSVSCVVMTTPHTPWEATLRAGGGLIVDRTTPSWGRAISDVASWSPHRLHMARQSAGQAYTRWATRPRDVHIWEQAFDTGEQT